MLSSKHVRGQRQVLLHILDVNFVVPQVIVLVQYLICQGEQGVLAVYEAPYSEVLLHVQSQHTTHQEGVRLPLVCYR